ncbi:MAG: preprotein translocase subunit SecE [Flavobacteriaceae bacterium]|nr:preprotein translocase subunit SecE [Flavobacteriaceae bacterium]
MSSFVNFVKNSIVEFKEKVEWPKWNELQTSMVIVFISAVLLAVFTFGVDTAFSMAIKNLYSLFIGLFN